MFLRLLYSILTVFALLVVITGCRKSEGESSEVKTHSSEAVFIAEIYFNDMIKQVHLAALASAELDTASTNDNLDGCLDTNFINNTNGTFPLTLILDYGAAAGSSCSDELNRKGKLLATFTGKYRDSLTQITIEPNNYFVNDIQVEGKVKLNNKGRNQAKNLRFRNVVDKGTITGDSISIEWSSKRFYEWSSGASTTDESDDTFTITGTFSGRSTKGNSFLGEIDEPLQYMMSCRWIMSGKATVKPENLVERPMDYGNGSCDNKAVVQLYGKDFEISD